jgi:hypothetical protein
MLASNAPSPKQNKKPYVISKGRKFEKARGRRKSRGAFIISIACTSRNIDTDSLDLHHRLQGQLSAFFLFCCYLAGWSACSGVSVCSPTARRKSGRRSKESEGRIGKVAAECKVVVFSSTFMRVAMACPFLRFSDSRTERDGIRNQNQFYGISVSSACSVSSFIALRLSAAGSASRVDSVSFRSNSELRPKELVCLPLTHYRSIPSTGSCRWPYDELLLRCTP